MFLKKDIIVAFVIVFNVVCFTCFSQSNPKFKVVLDAGHGGKDYGTIHDSCIEKKIALDVTLKVGKILENIPNIEVLYTRKTDVFIELMERVDIANKAKANFFVSIHCNGVNNNVPLGTETYVMGLTKNASNLEVAKRENEVITLESDYKLKYNGFDPNAPESMIGIKLLQEEYIDQSIILASKIQNRFTIELKRKNRGVKQGPILVLNQSAMPSVLVELGFISNKTEGAYLSSEKGQNELARSIADAIIDYKSEYFGNSTVFEKPSQPKFVEKKKSVVKTSGEVSVYKEEIKKNIADTEETIFKVQISAGDRKIDITDSSKFKGLDSISSIYEKKLYKYMYGDFESYDTAKKGLLKVKAKGFAKAFIIAFKNGKKISLKEALE